MDFQPMTPELVHVRGKRNKSKSYFSNRIRCDHQYMTDPQSAMKLLLTRKLTYRSKEECA
jgi:hypothetical protein